MLEIPTAFGSFILAWTVFLMMLIGIGGYFMLRKFLPSMPKQDGRSEKSDTKSD